jgi:hypothetical protein
VVLCAMRLLPEGLVYAIESIEHPSKPPVKGIVRGTVQDMGSLTREVRPGVLLQTYIAQVRFFLLLHRRWLTSFAFRSILRARCRHSWSIGPLHHRLHPFCHLAVLMSLLQPMNVAELRKILEKDAAKAGK